MMNFLKYLVFAFLFIVTFVMVYGFMQPKKIRVSITENIDAPVEETFRQINDLKNWKNWNYWHHLDSDWIVKYSNPSMGVNAWYEWVSDDPSVGAGKCTIIESVPNQKVICQLYFRDWNDAIGENYVKAIGDQTEVRMEMNLNAGNNPLMRIFNEKVLLPGLTDAYTKSLENLNIYLVKPK